MSRSSPTAVLGAVAAAIAVLIAAVLVIGGDGERPRGASPASPPAPTAASSTAGPAPGPTSTPVSSSAPAQPGRPTQIEWATPQQREQITADALQVAADWGTARYVYDWQESEEQAIIGDPSRMQTDRLTAEQRAEFAQVQSHRSWTEFAAQKCSTVVPDATAYLPANYGYSGTELMPSLTEQWVYFSGTVNTMCDAPDPAYVPSLPFGVGMLLHLVPVDGTWLVDAVAAS